MPWSPNQTSAVERPSIISYGHWNIRKSCLPTMREKTAQDSRTHQVMLVPSLATPLLDLPQHGMCKTCHPSARTPPTQQPMLDHEANGQLSKKPLGSFMEAPNPFPPARPHFSHPINPVLMATMVYLFLAQRLSYLEHMEPYTIPPLCSTWNYVHQGQAFAMKFRKSSLRWTRAIIQQLWNIAWDLLAHQNEENTEFGSGQPSTRWIVHLNLISLNRTASTPRALVSTVN